ncbi:hypothetical protein B9Z65_1388 [Elsinoe australis]|uniref:FHA domain-containing protein n=1 Tax=Elsinoe australis TaxID=40998 RepID=A0A2P7YFS0_9PEZI|nr:hypothetical protein B9Z65_1388 [Elsinoe australis]
MTAVAPPVQLQQPNRTGWNSVNGGQNGFGNMSQEEVGRLFMPGPRKSAQRSNSSSSLNSNSSSTSTISASSATGVSNGAANDSWAARKKTTRGIWPPGKSEPTSGLSTARPQSVSSASSGPSAASAISALHGPLLPSQQMANGQMQQNGVPRNGAPAEGSAFLYLLPMNGTFERKTIHVPCYPDVLRIGRQTNAKTAPTPTNGFFDSKVLSRQHAEVYAERNGRIFIRDVKSSNGTFVNGKRLSPENKESEPHELREQDVLELGIDIVSEDQKTVVHHKVAARVEHAGIYPQGVDIGFGDLDPAATGGLMSAQQLKRAGGHPGLPGIKTAGPMNGPGSAVRDPSAFQQQPWSRMWLQPISTEQIVKRLNRELNLAKQQQQDIARAKQSLDQLARGEAPVVENEEKKASDIKPLASPKKNRHDISHFPEPPAPPPSQPLPEKPDISKALNDPAIQPLLQRSDTARPSAFDSSSSDHSQALFILTHELKSAKDQIPSLQDRVKALEQQLEKERTARVTAEERAYLLEHGPRKDSAEPAGADSLADLPKPASPSSASSADASADAFSMSDLQSQLERLQANMLDMKQQMETYRRRAETAESDRDQARQTLQEMIQEKRERMAEEEKAGLKMTRQRSMDGHAPSLDEKHGAEANGHTIRPMSSQVQGVSGRAIPIAVLLQQAGLEMEGKAGEKMMTRQQAVSLQRVLRKEVLGDESSGEWEAVRYHGLPGAAALGTVVLGLVVMRWLNGWEAVKR